MSTYYVSLNGVDSDARDGLSWETAWASLAYASDRVPAGDHTIQLGSGTFVATETARPKDGVTIAGIGREGESATQIIASPNWALSPDPRESASVLDEYLIVIEQGQGITIRDLVLASSPENRITGAVYAVGSDNITVRDTIVRDFRWAGLHFELSDGLNIYNNYIENASTERFEFSSGLIRTRFIKNSDIHYNTVIQTVGRGYGYKGSGHENVRITHNVFKQERGFSIESAHENEFGVEIAYNYANQTISIPKGTQSADPANRGYDYTFWVHHNLLTDSYAIEGPRNHLRVSHNYIRIDETGGNVYTQHGGINNGPVWIHNNVVENVDRGLVWMNQGLAEDIYVYNNTVTLADAGDRAGAILSAPNRDGLNENLNNWVARNNIFIAPDSQPRELFPDNGVGSKITATDNILVNVTNVPSGNYVDIDPGFTGSGDRPWPFYAPVGSTSSMVDQGANVGLPFLGVAPDIGAYEFGASNPFPVSVALLDIETLINGIDADSADAAARIAAGETIFLTYEVTNIGTIAFDAAGLTVLDAQGLTPIRDVTSDFNSDNLLEPGETWIYTVSTIAEDLTANPDGELLYRTVGTAIASHPGENSVGTSAAAGSVATDTAYYRNPLTAGILFSLDNTLSLEGLSITDEDIIQFDGVSFLKFFEGADVGLSDASISAFDVISDTEILFSFDDPITLAGLGTVDDSDIIKFTASSLGDVTTGTFTMYFDGSDVGLDRNGEDIDALTQLPDGSLLISTKGSIRVEGVNGNDEDILRFIPANLGEDTVGSWVFFFDGSDVELGNDNYGDIDALSLAPTGQLILSNNTSLQPGELLEGDEDLVLFTTTSTGENTSGTFEAAYFFEGSPVQLYQDVSGVDFFDTRSMGTANIQPDAQDDTAAIPENQTLLIEVLSNDIDADADPLSVTAINNTPITEGVALTLASRATVLLNADGNLTYDPNGQFTALEEGEIANDSFNYTVSDGRGGKETATVVITILGVATPNTAPVTTGILDLQVSEGATNTVIPLFDVFEDLEDPDPDLVYEVVANTNTALFEAAPSIDLTTGELTLDFASTGTGITEITVRATDTAGAFVDTIFSVTVHEAPLLSTDSVIRIEAENYRAGTNGIDYKDFGGRNVGGAYRPEEAVDITVTDDITGDFHVGWIRTGEWLTYDINVLTAGIYDAKVRVNAGQADTKSFTLTIDDQSFTQTFVGTDDWQDVMIPGIALGSGAQEVRMDMNTDSFQFNYIELVPAGLVPS